MKNIILRISLMIAITVIVSACHLKYNRIIISDVGYNSNKNILWIQLDATIKKTKFGAITETGPPFGGYFCTRLRNYREIIIKDIQVLKKNSKGIYIPIDSIKTINTWINSGAISCTMPIIKFHDHIDNIEEYCIDIQLSVNNSIINEKHYFVFKRDVGEKYIPFQVILFQGT